MAAVLLGLPGAPARAQFPGQGGPPSVGVVRAEKQPITETSEFVGRIAAVNRVELVARVTAFLEQRKFVEGSEVKKGDLLYVLEQPPFQADLAAKQAAVQQAQAQLANATLAYQRAKSLLKTPAGQQSAVDAARATMLSDAAQVLAAQAQQKQSEINLGYTEIHAPIDGKIGRTAVTVGNVVTPELRHIDADRQPGSDVRGVPDLAAHRARIAPALCRQGRHESGVVIKLRLPDGREYGQTGTLDFMDNTVSPSTDTLILRGRIPNPLLTSAQGQRRDGARAGRRRVRHGAAGRRRAGGAAGDPARRRAVRHAGRLRLYCGCRKTRCRRRRITLGQSTPTAATVLTASQRGEMVIVDGVQKVHPGQAVAPSSAASPTESPRRPQLKGESAAAAPSGAEERRRAGMISAVFIRRPRLAIVIAIVITLAGALAMTRIPVSQLPDIVPPQVRQRQLSGRLGRHRRSAVAQPIEAQVIGADKMIYMKSNSGNDGSYGLSVSFALGCDPDIDTVNVNNRVQTALAQLPAEVQAEGLTVQKKSSAILEFLAFYSDDPKMDPLFVTNYVLINVLDTLSRTPGVGQANLFSKLNYSMRVWFHTDRLVSLDLSPNDIVAAIQQQSVVAPVGRIGARPIGNGQQFQFNVQTQGRLVTAKQFGNIVIRANPDGSVLRVRDVADVQLGAQNMDSETRLNGRPAVPVAIYLAPGANAVETAAVVSQALAALSTRFPAGLHAHGHVQHQRIRQRHRARSDPHPAGGVRAGGAGGVPVPRQRARHHHSDGGGAGQPDRHLRRAAGTGLHREHRLAAGDGAGDRRRGR